MNHGMDYEMIELVKCDPLKQFQHVIRMDEDDSDDMKERILLGSSLSKYISTLEWTVAGKQELVGMCVNGLNRDIR